MQLMEEYGAVHAINLLGTKENEASLTVAYDRHLQTTRADVGDDLGVTHYDFHNAVRVAGHDSVIRDLRYGMVMLHDYQNLSFTMFLGV